MQENKSFISFENDKAGMLFDQSFHPQYPLRYHNVVNGDFISYPQRSYYGYVYEGEVVIDNHENGSSQRLVNGMFFSYCGDLNFNPFAVGKCILIEVFHQKGVYPMTKFKAYNTYGGSIEKNGRLKYIDGCTDSLLIPPVKLGDPCLNHLHFPRDIDQTPHTHPSHRIGIVAKGHGECVTPFGNLPLKEGMIFVIKEWDGNSYSKGLDGEMYPDGTHKFKTSEVSMDVIAFHPDSDFGATDVDHPMINRTIVDGVSANQIESIRTK